MIAEQAALVLRCLVEGMSVRSTSRITEVHHVTISELLAKPGTACTAFQNEMLINLPCTQVQCDEIWAFVYAKDKRTLYISLKAPRITGAVWTWVSMCADTKLVCSWLLGDRTTESALELMQDIAPRFTNRIQLTRDGLKAYREAVEIVFGSDIDFTQLVNTYSPKGGDAGERRNGEKHPETMDFIRKDMLEGHTDTDRIST